MNTKHKCTICGEAFNLQAGGAQAVIRPFVGATFCPACFMGVLLVAKRVQGGLYATPDITLTNWNGGKFKET